MLPWGDGICGAEAAARHHLGKPANQLKPREAAWLASLLINPDLQLRRWALEEEPARERAAWVLKGIKRLPRERREAAGHALAGLIAGGRRSGGGCLADRLHFRCFARKVSMRRAKS